MILKKTELSFLYYQKFNTALLLYAATGVILYEVFFYQAIPLCYHEKKHIETNKSN